MSFWIVPAPFAELEFAGCFKIFAPHHRKHKSKSQDHRVLAFVCSFDTESPEGEHSGSSYSNFRSACLFCPGVQGRKDDGADHSGGMTRAELEAWLPVLREGFLR